MDRRTFLGATASVASLVATSGCLREEIEAAEEEPEPLTDVFSPEEVDLPVQQRYEVAGAAIERAASAGIDGLDDFETYLEEQDVQVESLEEAESDGEPVVELEYVSEQQADRGFLEYLGLVAGGYAALVATGHESELLEATLLDTSGRTFGTFEIERPWAEAYSESASTAREYAGHVTDTAETTTH